MTQLVVDRLDTATRAALAELLLAMADDEFVLGYWDSEWTGIAPMLEEDVAFSSIAQDEIGHARVLYELLAGLTDDEADRIAYGRQPDEYRHARLLNHARGDWAFSIARRYLYDTADAVRLEALSRSAYTPLAQVVAKIRREETYHLMHMDLWLRRLAEAGHEGRDRLVTALERLWPDALTVFSPLAGETALVRARILPERMEGLAQRWLGQLAPVFDALELRFPFLRRPSQALADSDPTVALTFVPRVDPRLESGRTERNDDFRWLWGEFTMVHRQEEGATW